jgi:lipoate-protein ligase A
VRRKNGLLQHGTLPLTGDLGRICDALAYADDAEREQARASVYRRAITLQDALGRPVTWQEAADAVAAGLRSVFDVTLTPGMLSEREQHAADHAERDRYAFTAKPTIRG